jgi:hypothetical protein
VPKIRTYTDETALGFINEDIDAIWTALGVVPDLDDIGDVTITTPADNEVLAYNTGTANWINQTAAEAGLALAADLNDYVLLAGDTMTGALTIQHGTSAELILDDTGGTYEFKILSADDRLQFRSAGVQKGRFNASTNTWEWVIYDSQPTGLIANGMTFYRDESDESLWATWKDSTPTTHHAMIARAKRTKVSLSPGSCTGSGVTQVIQGANTDISAVQFPNGSTTTAAWSFTRPPDWDYGKVRVRVYWMNYDNNVTGNHYWPQRLVGCATGEHTGPTQTCATVIAGAQTTAGLNDSSKIGETIISQTTAGDQTGNDFYVYRIQRQGGVGSDTSGVAWEVIHITAEMLSV